MAKCFSILMSVSYPQDMPVQIVNGNGDLMIENYFDEDVLPLAAMAALSATNK